MPIINSNPVIIRQEDATPFRFDTEAAQGHTLITVPTGQGMCHFPLMVDAADAAAGKP